MGAQTVNDTRKYIYGKTRKEVKDKLNTALNQIQVGTYKEKTKKTLLEILKEIVQDRYDSNKTGESAYNTNLRTVERIKKSSIAKKQIQKITIEDLKGIKGFKEENIQLFGQYLIKSIIEIKSKYLK